MAATPAAVAARRLRTQRLAGQPAASPEAVVLLLGAVQSQDYLGAKWARAQRTKGAITSTDLDAAFNAGTILRTHVLRPTWHFVLPADIRWLLQVTAPRVRKLAAHYDRQFEIDAATRKRSRTVLNRALRGTSVTRADIGRALSAAGIEASGQRLGLLVMYADLDAIVCSGPLRGKRFTYALVDERAPAAPVLSEEEALAKLTLLYFTGRGPASLADFGWWSGLTQADGKRGVALVADQLDHDRLKAPATGRPITRPPTADRATGPSVAEL